MLLALRQVSILYIIALVFFNKFIGLRGFAIIKGYEFFKQARGGLFEKN